MRTRFASLVVPFVVVAAFAVVAASACGFVETTPKRAVILCAADADCAAGSTCDLAAHVCAPKGTSLDRQAPAIVDVAFQPAFVAHGPVELVVTANEAIASAPASAAPKLVFDGVADPGFALASVDGTTARFALDVESATVAEGAYPLFAVNLADDAHNQAERLTPGVVLVVDRTPPHVLALSVSHADASIAPALPFSAAPGANAMSISFAIDEDVADADVVVTAGTLTNAAPNHDIACTRLPANAFSCSATVVSTAFTDVADRVSVQARDRAGNAGEASVTVRTDLTPPSIVDAQVRIAKPGDPSSLVAAATQGATVHVDLLVSEPLSPTETPALTVVAGDAVLGGATGVQIDAVRWSFDGTFTFVGTTPTATLGVHLVDLVDNAADVAVAEVPLAQSVSSPCPPPSGAACVDVDGDGDPASTASCSGGNDCDDTDPLVNGGAFEIPGDGKDNDCAGDGDLPIDETTGVFVDADAPAGGIGTRAAPFNAFPEAVDAANVKGLGFVYLAATTTTYFAPSGDFRPSLVGGLDRTTWEPSPTGTSTLSIGAVDDFLGDAGAHAFVRIAFEAASGGNSALTTRADATLVDCATQFATGIAFAHGALLVGGRYSNLAFFDPRSAVVGALLDDDVDVKSGAALSLNGVTTGDHATIDGPFLTVEATARAVVTNSSIGAMVCQSCDSLDVWSSAVFAPQNVAELVHIDAGSGRVLFRNDIVEWRIAETGVPTAVFGGTTSRLIVDDNLFDIAPPAVLLLAQGAFTAADPATLDGCDEATPPACGEAFGNVGGSASFSGDDVHIGFASAALGAGSDELPPPVPPDAVAADVDGQCRPASGFDVGADQR